LPVSPGPLAPITPPKASDGSPEENFQAALDKMRQASDRMSQQLDVGLRTQRIQESALALMDQVIEEAVKQQQQQQKRPQKGGPADQGKQQSGSSQNAKPSQSSPSGPANSQHSTQPPSQDGASRGTPSEAQPDAPLHQTQSQWGNLPPRLRDQLLQGMNERFSPIYQRLTEAYYRRLAEESSSTTSSSAPPSSSSSPEASP
jgi:hypothetical protein